MEDRIWKMGGVAALSFRPERRRSEAEESPDGVYGSSRKRGSAV